METATSPPKARKQQLRISRRDSEPFVEPGRTARGDDKADTNQQERCMQRQAAERQRQKHLRLPRHRPNLGATRAPLRNPRRRSRPRRSMPPLRRRTQLRGRSRAARRRGSPMPGGDAYAGPRPKRWPQRRRQQRRPRRRLWWHSRSRRRRGGRSCDRSAHDQRMLLRLRHCMDHPRMRRRLRHGASDHLQPPPLRTMKRKRA